MHAFRQLLVNGVKCSPLKTSNSLYGIHPPPSIAAYFPRTLNPTGFALQIRLKSRKSNFNRPSASPPPSNASPASNPSSAYSPPPIRPIRPHKTVDVIYEKPTEIGSIFVDLKNWRHSRLLLTIVVNSAAFIVFCLWTWEAHKASKAKEKLDNGESNGSADESTGKYVPGTTTATRFVTPGQEWLLDNFTVTPLNYREGRYWTYLTSIFSHQLPSHTFVNVLVSHLLFTGLAPFGTIPVAGVFLLGGITSNIIISSWMVKRGSTNFDEKYPGQFYGGLGMSAANLSVLGFAAAVNPKWVVQLYGVIPIKISYVVIGAWFFEVFRYWKQDGWEKIQSSVFPSFGSS
jgi:hypothetical protein